MVGQMAPDVWFTGADGKKIALSSFRGKPVLLDWRQLEYKVFWASGELLAVPPQNTSRTCPQCGHGSKDNRKSQALFKCVQCGFEENADLVGAINVQRAGHARLEACRVNGEVSRQQQEPSEIAA
jgi:putative transposase